jgi:hypothetical protein
MRTFLISVLIFLCSTSSVFADTPVTAFYVVKTDELKELIPEGGKLEDVDLLRVEDISTAKGHFEGDCNFYLKTNDYQYHFKAVSTDDNLVFSFRMFSQKDKKKVFSSSGEVKVEEKFSAKKDWPQEEYAVLFRRANLSR